MELTISPYGNLNNSLIRTCEFSKQKAMPILTDFFYPTQSLSIEVDINRESEKVNLSEIVNLKQKITCYCTRLASNVANCFKKIFLGIAAMSILIPIQMGANFIAQKIGLLPELTNEIFEDSVDILKGKELLVIVIGPIVEEVLFRGFVQDLLLYRVPKNIIKKIAPGKESVLDYKIAKVCRIIFTAVLFSSAHLVNLGKLPDAYVYLQLLATFVMGIGLGLLKESKAGLLGATTAHMTNNLVAMKPW